MADRVFYTIAQETSEVYGMGDTGTVLRICKRGAYESEDFPPLFTSEEETAHWLRQNRALGGVVYKIVKLKVADVQ